MSSVIKEKSEASLLFVGIFAVLMAGFGGLLGFIYLMSFPLQAHSSMQERAEALEDGESSGTVPGNAFFVEGPVLRTSGWMTKRQQLIDGSTSTIKLSAGEINAWLAAKFRPSSVQESVNAEGLLIEPGRPNVGITRKGATYLNLPTKIKGYGLDGDYVFSAKVRYASGTPASLRVERVHIGGAAVPLPGILGARLVSAVLQGYGDSEEHAVIQEAWGRVRSVEAADGALVLTMDTP